MWKQNDKQYKTLLPTSGYLPLQHQVNTVLHHYCYIYFACQIKNKQCFVNISSQMFFPSLHYDIMLIFFLSFSLSKFLIHLFGNELVCASVRSIFEFYTLMTDTDVLVCCSSPSVDRHLKHQSEISYRKPRCWRHMVLIHIRARFFKHTYF